MQKLLLLIALLISTISHAGYYVGINGLSPSGPSFGYTDNLSQSEEYYLSGELQSLFSFTNTELNNTLNIDWKIGKQNAKVSPFVNFVFLTKLLQELDFIGIYKEGVNVSLGIQLGGGMKYRISDDSDLDIGWRFGYEFIFYEEEKFLNLQDIRPNRLNNFYISVIYHL
jgi:hypothetical protein